MPRKLAYLHGIAAKYCTFGLFPPATTRFNEPRGKPQPKQYLRSAQFNNGVLIKFQFQMSSVEQSKLIRLLQELEDVGPELFSVLNNPPFPENPFNRRLAYHRDFTFKVNDTFRFPTGSRNTEVNYCVWYTVRAY